MSDGDLTLRQAFEACRKLCEPLEETSGTSALGESEMAELKGHIASCMGMVNSLGLFSSNEDKDDIITSHLKYVLLPYYLGLYYMASGGSVSDGGQLESVENAARCFRGFVASCADKDLLEDDIRKGTDSMGRTEAVSRQQKIEQYKRQKDLKRRIESLAGALHPSSAPPADDDDVGDEGPNEEQERELALLQINHAAMNAAQWHANLSREVEILKFAEGARAAGTLPQPAPEREREKQAVFDSLKNAAVCLQADRQRLAQGVFKPSHILPTMTVEEFGELELERLRQTEARAASQPQACGGSECDDRECSEHSDSDDEDALRKAREWDDFKDANPRGWGNSALRPCR